MTRKVETNRPQMLKSHHNNFPQFSFFSTYIFVNFIFLYVCLSLAKYPSNQTKIFRSFLLSHSVELQKANLTQEQSGNGGTNGTSAASLTNNNSNVNAATNPPNGGGNTTGPSSTDTATSAAALASAIPLAQLLSKPGALNALTSLTALGGLTDLLGGLTNLGPPVQTTGVHRSKVFNARARPSNNAASNDMNKLKERSKFNPY